MNKVLYRVDSSMLIRCACCLEIKRAAFKDSDKHRNFCERCAYNIRLPKLSTEEWAMFNRSQSHEIPKTTESKETFLVENDKKEKVILSKLQYDVLNIVREPGMRFQENYVLLCSKRIERKQTSVQHACGLLRKKGFYIPNQAERIRDLKLHIWQEFSKFKGRKSFFINHLASDVGYSPLTIRDHLQEMINKSITDSDKRSLAEKMIEFLGLNNSPCTILELEKRFAEYSRAAIRITVKRLEEKGVIERYKLEGEFMKVVLSNKVGVA